MTVQESTIKRLRNIGVTDTIFVDISTVEFTQPRSNELYMKTQWTISIVPEKGEVLRVCHDCLFEASRQMVELVCKKKEEADK